MRSYRTRSPRPARSKQVEIQFREPAGFSGGLSFWRCVRSFWKLCSALPLPANHTGPNSFPLNTRLLFAASSEPLIEIFDTHCYQRVSSIPIRDPIIGPIKAAYRVATGQLVLVGATARGVVIAQLPNTFTTTCP